MSVKHQFFLKIKPEKLVRTYEGNDYEITLCCVGLFDTIKLHWDYYAFSAIELNTSTGKSLHMTSDLSSFYEDVMMLTIESITKKAKKFSTKEESINYIEEYKTKWESGSNCTVQETRDEKIKKITGE